MSYKAVDPVVNGSTAILLDESDGFLGYQDRDGEIKPVLANVGLFANNLITDANGSGFLGVVDPITGKEHWMQNEKDGSKVSFKGPQGVSGPIGYPGLTIRGEIERPSDLVDIKDIQVNDAYVITKTHSLIPGNRRGDVLVFNEDGNPSYRFNCEGPQGKQGVQGVQGSHYINAYFPDQRFESTPSDVVAQCNHKPGDFSISSDTQTIWVYDGDEFISGPSIRGSRMIPYNGAATAYDILIGENHETIQNHIRSEYGAKRGDYVVISDGTIIRVEEDTFSNTGMTMKGLKGEQGPKGDQGEKGETGAQGPQGEPGSSLTELDGHILEAFAKPEGGNIILGRAGMDQQAEPYPGIIKLFYTPRKFISKYSLWFKKAVSDTTTLTKEQFDNQCCILVTNAELSENGSEWSTYVRGLDHVYKLSDFMDGQEIRIGDSTFDVNVYLIHCNADTVSTCMAEVQKTQFANKGPALYKSLCDAFDATFSKIQFTNFKITDTIHQSDISDISFTETNTGAELSVTYTNIIGNTRTVVHQIKDGVNGVNGTNGITPQLKAEDGFWKVSYDNGNSWEQIAEYVGKQDINAISKEVSQVSQSVNTLSTQTQRHESNLTDVNNLLFQGGDWFEDMEELSPEITGFDKEYSDIPHYIMYHNNILQKDINYESGELPEEESYPLYGEHEGYTDPAYITYNLHGDYCTVSVSNLLLINGWADMYFRLPVEPVEETNTIFMAIEGSEYQQVCCTVGHHDYPATGITEPVLWFRTCDTDTYHTDYHISLTITYKYRNNEDF